MHRADHHASLFLSPITVLSSTMARVAAHGVNDQQGWLGYGVRCLGIKRRGGKHGALHVCERREAKQRPPRRWPPSPTLFLGALRPRKSVL